MNNNKIIRYFLAVQTRRVVLSMLVATMPLSALLITSLTTNSVSAQSIEPEKGKANLNFSAADIETVVRAVGHFTGNTFIIDPRVKGTINLISEKPVTKEQALQLLNSALRLQGYAVVRTADYIKVVPEADAKLQAAPVQVEQIRGDQIMTKIFRLSHESATTLINVLRPLITANNTISSNAANNTLIITDYADNIKRLAKIIASLDVPALGELEAVPIKNGIASDLVSVINRLLDQGTAAAPGSEPGRVVLMAEPRTNAIIVRAPTAARIALVRTLIEKLDQPTALPGNVHVVYLKNAEAVKLAQVLRSVVSSDTSLQNMATTAASQTTSQPSGQLNAPSASSTLSAGFAPLNSSSSSINLGSSGAAGFIQADPTTNSLIITANEVLYKNLRGIIDQLDARRAQVYVESLIVEVSTSKAAEFGVQWAGGAGIGNSDYRVGALTSFSTGGNNLVAQAGSLLGANGTPLAPGNGISVGLLKQAGGKLELAALARALETDANANILSMPNLFTLDNEEARIIVGQNVPFITGQFTTAASGNSAGVNPFQTIERRDIGLSLRVRPQISEGGTVKMAIYQETSTIQQTTISGLITSKRSIDTNVLVDDGQIIVLGGLIEDSINETTEKVPGLGNLPYIGALFRYQTKKRGKTSLMVFLRPTVVRNEGQSTAVAGDRYDYIRGSQLSSKQIDALVLPPFDSGKISGDSLLKTNPTSPVSKGDGKASANTIDKPGTPSEVYSIEPPTINLR
jgi:general secretion pathway protein D